MEEDENQFWLTPELIVTLAAFILITGILVYVLRYWLGGK